MISIILVSHGPVAKAMMESACMITGKSDYLYSIGLEPQDSIEDFRAQVEALLTNAQQQGEAVILSDFPLGTPFNEVTRLMQKHLFHHITGMNMPMLLNLLQFREEETITDLCARALQQAREQAMNVNEYIKGLVL